ncbi:MAG: leucine-rich repeat domain-containing protein [Blastocatellia bacterium]
MATHPHTVHVKTNLDSPLPADMKSGILVAGFAPTRKSQMHRTIQFPLQPIGRLSVRAAGSQDEWADFAEACGIIIIPDDKEAHLTVAYVDFDLQAFTAIAPDALTVFEWVSSRRVTDAAITNIRHLTGLQGLALWETSIGDETLFNLRHLSNLRWLDIGDTQITDVGLSYLSEMPLLYSLTLLNDRITDAGIAHLQRLPSLTHLDLMNTLVTDHGVATLKRLKGLRHLRVFGAGMTESGYRELKRALPGCRIWFHRSNDLPR